jgi:hypothetical protein
MALNPHPRWAWAYSRNGRPEQALRAQVRADAERAMPELTAASAGANPGVLVSLNGL